ncbi:tyrosine-protein phosphatase [Nocardioides sp. BGMRC 2183]|nr:tyrosine-protein phosphatase [Nocardioides sp. BGMRC 2183]
MTTTRRIRTSAWASAAAVAVVALTAGAPTGPASAVPAGPAASEQAHPVTANAGRQSVEVVRNASGSHTVSWSAPGRHLVYASTRPGNPSRSGDLVGVSRWGSVVVKGLADDARWYFEVVSPRQHRGKQDPQGTVVSTRELGLDSTTNTRDLGGYRTVEGRTVRWGLVFRSDAIPEPTTRDVAILRGLRLRHSYDFRGENEIANDGANALAASVRQHSMPLLDASTEALSDAIQAVLASGDPTAAEELLGDGKAEQIAATGPSAMMARATTQRAFGSMLRALAAPGGSPMVFNCTAGKDRTGVFSAILLRVLGVGERAIMADYELSNVYRAEYNAATYAYLAKAGIATELIRPLMEQDGANIAAMFDSIEEEHGNFDRFVRSGLGLDRRTVTALRDRLLS